MVIDHLPSCDLKSLVGGLGRLLSDDDLGNAFGIQDRCQFFSSLPILPKLVFNSHMCRIMAMCGELKSDVISDAFKKFGALAESGTVPKGVPSGHKDGWGIVAYANNEIAVYEKEPKSATDNTNFTATIKKVSTTNPKLLIAHLRKASIGSNILENAQPYAYENYSFCHNGTIKDFQNFPLNDDFFKLRKGTNDSEWIFYYLVQEIRKNPGLSFDASFKKFVGGIQSLNYTAFNTFFSDGHHLLATREANESDTWVKKEGLCDYYYTLFIGTSADQKTKIICSEKLDLKDITWKEIPNHTMAVIDVQTGQEKMVSI